MRRQVAAGGCCCAGVLHSWGCTALPALAAFTGSAHAGCRRAPRPPLLTSPPSPPSLLPPFFPLPPGGQHGPPVVHGLRGLAAGRGRRRARPRRRLGALRAAAAGDCRGEFCRGGCRGLRQGRRRLPAHIAAATQTGAMHSPCGTHPAALTLSFFLVLLCPPSFPGARRVCGGDQQVADRLGRADPHQDHRRGRLWQGAGWGSVGLLGLPGCGWPAVWYACFCVLCARGGCKVCVPKAAHAGPHGACIPAGGL